MGMSRVDYNGETLINISNDTVTPETLAEGATAHNANGDPITGTAKIGGGGGGSSNTLHVTATAVLTSQTGGSLRDISHTFAEIQNAYNDGLLIYFSIDAGEIAQNTKFVMPMCIIEYDSHVCCTTILDMSGTLMYIQFFITAGNNGSFIIKPI